MTSQDGKRGGRNARDKDERITALGGAPGKVPKRSYSGGTSSPAFARLRDVRGGEHAGGRGGLVLILVLALATFALVFIGLGLRESAEAPAVEAAPPPPRFALCRFGEERPGDCVYSGDSFRVGGAEIRLAGIVVPSRVAPACDEEAERALEAQRRLLALLNSGPVRLEKPADAEDRDAEGRLVRRAYVDDNSVGGLLIADGLARHESQAGPGWCR